MKLVEPVDRAREQKAANFVARVVEDERAPIRVLAFLRIAVLVERRSVEARKRVIVFREVSGHPVEQNADTERVKLGDEGAQVVGIAVAARRREVARALVAPRVVERMLGYGQELDVREAELAHVPPKPVPELAVIQELAVGTLAPRAQVHLVYRERLAMPITRCARLQPLAVRPYELRNPRGQGGIRRSVLEHGRIGIRLDAQLAAIAVANLEPIELVGAELRHE